MQVYLNGTEVTPYVEGPTSETVIDYRSGSALSLGNTGFSLYIDELRAWYQEFSAQRVYEESRRSWSSGALKESLSEPVCLMYFLLRKISHKRAREEMRMTWFNDNVIIRTL